MDYLPPRPLDAHSAFILGQQIARLHQWSDQPQFGLDFDNALSTTPQPNTGNVAGQLFLLNNGLAGSWNWRQKRDRFRQYRCHRRAYSAASGLASTAAFSGDLWSGNCALGPDGPYIFDPACYWGDRECDRRCYRCIQNSRHKSMTAISQYPIPADFLERQPVYQLYTLLNRARLFGGQHLVIAQQSLDRLLAA